MIEIKVAQETEIFNQVLLPRVDYLVLGLQNLGSTALNSFEIQFRVEKGGTWYSWYSSSSDWTNIQPESSIRESNGDPTTLAAGAKVAFTMDELNGWAEIRVVAGVSSGSTTLKVEIGGE